MSERVGGPHEPARIPETFERESAVENAPPFDITKEAPNAPSEDAKAMLSPPKPPAGEEVRSTAEDVTTRTATPVDPEIMKERGDAFKAQFAMEGSPQKKALDKVSAFLKEQGLDTKKIKTAVNQLANTLAERGHIDDQGNMIENGDPLRSRGEGGNAETLALAGLLHGELKTGENKISDEERATWHEEVKRYTKTPEITLDSLKSDYNRDMSDLKAKRGRGWKRFSSTPEERSRTKSYNAAKKELSQKIAEQKKEAVQAAKDQTARQGW